jgi:hypothetical protein
LYCPICRGKLHVDDTRLLCDRCGEMKVYVDHDPYGTDGTAVVEHYEFAGLEDLEVQV